MHVDLTEGLVVLPGAVASEGVDLVAHGHGSMVDSPRPSFQVHRPAQHSTPEHLLPRLPVLRPSLGRPTGRHGLHATGTWREERHVSDKQNRSGSGGEHKGEVFDLSG